MSAPAVEAPRELFPGYSVPSPSYVASPLRYTPLYRLLLILGVTLAVIVIVIATVSALFIKPAVLYSCPPECGRPPTGVPVQESPRFTAADGSFSVSYPSPGTNYTVTQDPDGISAVWTAGDGGTMELFGLAAAGRRPEQVLDDLIRQKQPDATVAYQLPNATVGFQLGFGEVLDVYPQTSSGSASAHASSSWWPSRTISRSSRPPSGHSANSAPTADRVCHRAPISNSRKISASTSTVSSGGAIRHASGRSRSVLAPSSVTVAPDGTVYVTNTFSKTVSVITPSNL